MHRLQRLLDWLYPPVCIACNMIIPIHRLADRELGICRHCTPLLAPIDQPVCTKCGGIVEADHNTKACPGCFGKDFAFLHNQSTYLYDALMRDMMHNLKYRADKNIAHSLGKLWAAAGHLQLDNPKPDYVTYLPMHRKKQKARGFNQAEILARYIASHHNIPLQHTTIRTRNTPPQYGLHPHQRIENVRGAFAIPKNIHPKGKSYIIIDDIYTTGASLNECARILKKAGATHVTTATLCTVPKK